MTGAGLNSRGVAFWRGDDDETRVLIAGRQRLFSVDARTGKLDVAFGSGGVAALHVDLGREIPRLHTQVTSPPVVYKNLVIVGSGMADRLQYRVHPPGAVQAFDIRTGKRAWVFFTIPQSANDFGADTWAMGRGVRRAHERLAPMAFDETRGLLYLPTSTPSGDYWGGWRPGANLFAESLVCVDALTGQRKWHFQAVHHGLWDYDFGFPPTLATITVNGRTIDAVAQVSKQGFGDVFDRAGRWLSPNRSTGRSSRSSRVSCRFANGVSSVYLRRTPPSSRTFHLRRRPERGDPSGRWRSSCSCPSRTAAACCPASIRRRRASLSTSPGNTRTA